MNDILESNRWPEPGSVLQRFLTDLLPQSAVQVHIVGEPTGSRELVDLFPGAVQEPPCIRCPLAAPRHTRLECCVQANAKVESIGRFLAALSDLARETDNTSLPMSWARGVGHGAAVVCTRSDGAVFRLEEPDVKRQSVAWYLFFLLAFLLMLVVLMIQRSGASIGEAVPAV